MLCCDWLVERACQGGMDWAGIRWSMCWLTGVGRSGVGMISIGSSGV